MDTRESLRIGILAGRHRLAPILILSIGCGLSAEAAETPGDDWIRQVTASIAEAEYEVTWQPRTKLADLDAAWQAPNRAQGFRTYFTETGPRLIPRVGAEPTWEWGLALVGYGRGGVSRPVESPSLGPTGHRIEYARGDITEWYENSSRGLKQGFALWVRPEGPAGLVHLDLRLDGTLEPVIAEDGQAVDFRTGEGVNVLHYAELVVTDADGRELPAWIEGFSSEGFAGIRIVFDAEGAVFPVTVDPLATTPAWTAESNQPGAEFGVSVATAGDVNGDGYSDVIVGAWFYDAGFPDTGRAYVYHGASSGLSETAAWTAESDQARSLFGYSVATAGDVNGDGYSDVIVGEWYYDAGWGIQQGRAHVFLGSALGLSGAATWTAVGKQNSQFGYSVATAGDVNEDGYSDVIVTASGEPAVYVFHGSSSGLPATHSWSTPTHATSVATAGDVNGDGYSDIIVGFDGGLGSADVYHGSSSGLSTTAAWTAVGSSSQSYFGHSVATAGDVNGDGYADAIVGEYWYRVEFGSTRGRALVYHGSAAGLSPVPAWTALGDGANTDFGDSVGTAGDVNGDGYADVIVGAQGLDSPEIAEGGAYVYFGSASGLSLTANWAVESNSDLALFGSSVATAGDVNGDGYSDVIVGAHNYDNGHPYEGGAFVYHGSAAGLSAAAGWTTESNQAAASFGASVAAAGDVNGDGYADIIVGAPLYDNAETDEGRAFVYHGSAVGPSTTEAWTAESNQAFADFGVSVAAAGDVNGDGYSDVIVGADTYDNDQSDEGRAFVYHGSASGLSATAAWTAEGNQADAWFGASVAAAGDVNGDGRSDVIVGALGYNNGQTDEGRAFVYHGSVTGLSATAAWTGESNQTTAYYGRSVATAGDVNRDGYSDVIVGSNQYDNGQTDEGRAFVYHGSVSGLSATEAWTAESDQASALFGRSAATAGDVNGDGYSDVIVGAHLHDNPENNEGRAYVFHGSASGLSAMAAWTAESDQASAFFGYSVATAGDVNGDGYSDVIVGAHVYDDPETNEGRAYVFRGSAVGLSTTPSWTAESGVATAFFGRSVASAGDVNGDGYADVIVGAEGWDKGQTDEGGAFLFYGNDGRGVALRPRQRRGNDSAPIDHLGASNASDRFRLALLGRIPFGRGNVKLEWEVKPLGTPLNGTGISVGSTWIDTGVAGAALNQLVTGLAPVTQYHWRVRMRYHPATTPFQQRSRWLTVPRNGWQEADLRTASAYAGVIGPTLFLSRVQGGAIALNWETSCVDTDFDFAIYEGKVGNFYSHAVKGCSTNGVPSTTLTPGPESYYYLVVPLNGMREGSYGLAGSGQERPPALDACLAQEFGGCP